MNEIDLLREGIFTADLEGIRKILSTNPSLANEGIPHDTENPATEHPLHRLCDGVMLKLYSDVQAAEMAKLFLSFGARVDGFGLREKKDTPLVAAASLHADEVALLYIDHGATIGHGGCHGGTALHWAAWCGRDTVVRRLLTAGADVHRRCIDFKSTPLFWAIHGYKFGGPDNRFNQIECARLLLEHGADKNVPNAEGTHMLALLDDTDVEMRTLLKG
jgi:ankyrin repeat protein